jgi:hypothetical protein
VALIEVRREQVKKTKSSTDCLYCGKPVGIRRFSGAKYCSEAHSQADRQELQRLMVVRLRDFRASFRARLDGYAPESVTFPSSHKDALRSEVGPDNGVVGGPLSLARLQVYAYLTAGSGEGSGS